MADALQVGGACGEFGEVVAHRAAALRQQELEHDRLQRVKPTLEQRKAGNVGKGDRKQGDEPEQRGECQTRRDAADVGVVDSPNDRGHE